MAAPATKMPKIRLTTLRLQSIPGVETMKTVELTFVAWGISVVETYWEKAMVPVVKRMRPGIAMRRALVEVPPKAFSEEGRMGFPGETMDKRP